MKNKKILQKKIGLALCISCAALLAAEAEAAHIDNMGKTTVEASPYTLSDNLTIDNAGGQYTFAQISNGSIGTIIQYGGTMTIRDGKSGGVRIKVNNNGVFKMDGGVFVANGSGSIASSILAAEIEDSEMECCGDNVAMAQLTASNGTVRNTGNRLMIAASTVMTDSNFMNHGQFTSAKMIMTDSVFYNSKDEATPDKKLVASFGILDLTNSTVYNDGEFGSAGATELDKDSVIDNAGKLWFKNHDTAPEPASLTLNGGTIHQRPGSEDVFVESLKGGGGTILYDSKVDGSGGLAVEGGGFVVKNADSGASLTLQTQNPGVGLTTDNVESELNKLAEKLQYNGGNGNLAGAHVEIAEGAITPGAEAQIAFDSGKGNVRADTITVDGLAPDTPPDTPNTENPEAGNPSRPDSGVITTTMRGMRDISAIQLLAWRAENNDMNKRLGELRNDAGQAGIWARTYGGKTEYHDNYSNTFRALQIGYDRRVKENAAGVWHVGGAVSYLDGSTAYALGDGDNASYGLALYGSWLGKRGHFLDIIAKESRLQNEYTSYSKTGERTQGDYNNWGTSFSAEYGRRCEFSDGWYIEPQVELTYGHVGGAAYRTTNAVQVRQEGMNSLVGRLGFSLGRKLTERGNIYFSVSALREFAGEATTHLRQGSAVNRYEQSLEETWYEVNIGGNINLSDRSYAYVNVERSYGGEIKTPWKWNAGVRFSL